MIDISTALTSIQSVIGVLRKAGNIEATQHVIDLQQTLTQLATENAQRLETNMHLRDEVRSLGDALRLKDELRFARNAYWKGEGYDEANGPFCSRCCDVDHKAVRMVALSRQVARCPNCKAAVAYDARGTEPSRPRVISAGVRFPDDF
jgi:hypothetical protein